MSKKLRRPNYLATYIIIISIFLLSAMIIYLPFMANNQGVNFINLGNDEITTQATQQIAKHNTMFFYPAILLAGGTIFALTIAQLNHKAKVNVKKWQTYLSLGETLLLWIAQYSKLLTIPYALLFIYLFFEGSAKMRIQQLKRCYLKQKWLRWSQKLARKGRWLVPYLLVIGIYFIDNVLIFKANTGQSSLQILRYNRMSYVNFVAECLIFFFLYIILRHFWAAAILTGFAYNFFYLFSLVMRKMRNDAIVPSQLTELKGIKNLSGMISPVIIIGVIAALISFVYLSQLLKHLYPIAKPHYYSQAIWLSCFLAFYGSTFYWNKPDGKIANFLTNQLYDDRQFYNPSYGAEKNGPWAQFLNSVDIQIMQKPAGYSKAAMQRIVKEYQTQAQTINQHRNNRLTDFTVIYNLSESFSDPKRVPTVTYKKDPIPYIRQLKQTEKSGLMLSSGYGGGTANMEYMTLTSMPTTNYMPTLATPYTQIVPKYNRTYSIADNFTHTTAIHPYNTAFYDRITDYPKMGIHTFYNIDDKKHPIKHQKLIENNNYLSDQTAYANVIDQLNRQTQPQFINLVTMQNHTPWDNKYVNTDQWGATAGDGTDESTLGNYLTGINYTDKAVHQFVNQINNLNRPIVWVFYGDHLPGLYNNPMKEDGLALHKTDYFIYLNKAAKAKLGNQPLNQNYPNVDPNEFTAEMLEMISAKVNPFQALQTKALHQLPVKVMNTNDNETNQRSGNLQWINPKTGQIINHAHLTKLQQKIWHDYKLVQYDQTAGKHYLPANFFK